MQHAAAPSGMEENALARASKAGAAGGRRALGDLASNGPSAQSGNHQGVLTRRQAALAASQQPNGSWGTKPRPSLRARDPNVPVVSQAPPAERKAASAAAAPAAPAPRTHSQALEARSEAAAPPRRAGGGGLPDIDSADAADPLCASEFAPEIFAYYRRAEPAAAVSPAYMAGQADINEKMRAILVDWLVDVHLKFKLAPETLHLAANLIDRFLERRQVSRKHLQLVGVTAMLVASKYEEIWAPEVRDFVYISDKAYSRDQILGMEKSMLQALKFHLTVPTPHTFLARFLKAAGVAPPAAAPAPALPAAPKDRDAALYAAYLVELALVDYGMLRHPPSLLAAAAVYAAGAATGRPDPLPRALRRHCGHADAAVAAAAADLAALARRAPSASLVAVHKKYSHDKLHAVATRIAPPALGT